MESEKVYHFVNINVGGEEVSIKSEYYIPEYTDIEILSHSLVDSHSFKFFLYTYRDLLCEKIPLALGIALVLVLAGVGLFSLIKGGV